MAKKNKQAYKQAPWRRQIQSIGLSLLPVVAITVIISLYLIISAQSAAAGLQIMDLHYEEEGILRKIANQRTQLAQITSYIQMKKRAEEMGYEAVPASNVHYIKIAGYRGRDAILIAPPPGIENKSVLPINELYNQSLSNWFLDTFFFVSSKGSGADS
ncbi:MAG: hypothetical protein J7K66_00445 [Anaerolineaceae bacterium]|nr:hypothetical protein [Anaerolineaceae bacterium]